MSKLSSIEELFAGRHFDREVIILCVRWYLRYKLSFRDLVEMMAERVLSLAHTTIMRCVRRYASEFVKRWNRFGRSCGRSWRVDETYIKVRGQWVYLYRAVDKAGQTIDFRLSKTRDVAAAKAFFKKAIRHEGRPPHTITSWLDDTGAPVGVQQKLMRHAQISTTMNVYGNALMEAKREANTKVVRKALRSA
jgi:transposase-like protein